MENVWRDGADLDYPATDVSGKGPDSVNWGRSEADRPTLTGGFATSSLARNVKRKLCVSAIYNDACLTLTPLAFPATEICSTMVPGLQQDAHEFLVHLLDALEKSLQATGP